MSAGGWTLTGHAQQRRKEMGVTEHAVEDVLDFPLLDVPDLAHPGRRRAFGERLVIVYEPADGVVITVLWRSDHRPFIRAERVQA